MKKIMTAALVLLIGAITFYFSCTSSVTDNVGDTVIVNESSSMPTIDITGIDIISPPSSSISKISETPVGHQSSTGCLLKEIFNPDLSDTLKQAELSNCFIKKTQDLTPNFMIPLIESDNTDLYNYFQIALGSQAKEKTGIQNLRVRIANVSDGSSNTLKIDTCQSADGSSYTRTNHFEIQGIISTHTWSGTTVAHNIDGTGDENCTTTPCFFGGASFEIVMNSAGDLEKTFSWSNASSAAINGSRGRNPTTADVTDETTFDYLLNLDFGYTALDSALGVAKQSITGAVDIPANPIESATYSIYTANDGAAKLSHYNGQGIYDDTQAFKPNADPVDIIDSEGVSYYTGVADATVPSTDIAAAVRQNVAFPNTWDCAHPADRAFELIDASAYDFTTCEQLISTLTKPSVGAFDKCFGAESLAGNYTPRSPSTACPGGAITTTLTFSGSGPVYSVGTGDTKVEFAYQNSWCSNAKVAGAECTSCEVIPPSPTTSLTIKLKSCGDDLACYLQMTSF